MKPEEKTRLIHDYWNAIRSVALVFGESSAKWREFSERVLESDRAWPFPEAVPSWDTSHDALFQKLDRLTADENGVLNAVKNTVVLEVLRDCQRASRVRRSEASIGSEGYTKSSTASSISPSEGALLPPHLDVMKIQLAERGFERTPREENLYRELLVMEFFADAPDQTIASRKQWSSPGEFIRELHITSTEPASTACENCGRPF